MNNKELFTEAPKLLFRDYYKYNKNKTKKEWQSYKVEDSKD